MIIDWYKQKAAQYRAASLAAAQCGDQQQSDRLWGEAVNYDQAVSQGERSAAASADHDRNRDRAS